MKLFSIMWSSYIPILKEAAVRTGLFELKAYSTKQLNLEARWIEQVRRDIRSADLVLLYRTADPFWEYVDDEIGSLGRRIPVVAVGADPSSWQISSVIPEIVGAVHRYILYNGVQNFEEMLKYLASSIFSRDVSFKTPRETAWEGIYHPFTEVLSDPRRNTSTYTRMPAIPWSGCCFRDPTGFQETWKRNAFLWTLSKNTAWESFRYFSTRSGTGISATSAGRK